MTPEQREKIKIATGYNYEDILELPQNKFEWEFIGLRLKKRITEQQYNWLLQQRYKKRGITQQVQDALDIFGGKIIK